MLTVLAALLLIASASGLNCKDFPGAPPLANATAFTCADFVGWCDSESLSVAEKAKLMLHCPNTCKGTVYSDGGGHAYCACVPGHDCCFDEPPDCTKRGVIGTVVAQVLAACCQGPGNRGRRAAMELGPAGRLACAWP